MPSSSPSFQDSALVYPFHGQFKKNGWEVDWPMEIYKVTESYTSSVPFYKGISHQKIAPNWMLILLLLSYGCIAFVKAFYQKRFSMLFRSLLNWKISKQIIRYEKIYTHPANLLLLLNFTVIVPLFFTVSYQKQSSLSFSSIQLYFYILIPLLIYFLIKFLLYKTTEWLLNAKDVIQEYVFQTSLFNKYLGVTYLALTPFLIYAPVSSLILSYLGISILIAFLLFQLIRGVLIGLQAGIKLHLIILYLCTLEILPWLILGKFVIELL